MKHQKHSRLRSLFSKSLVAASILTLTITGAPVSQALSEGIQDFYSSNEVRFFDPDHTVCQPNLAGGPGIGTGTGTGAVVGSDNAEKIFNYLTSTPFAGLGGKPMTAIQAIGVLGNFALESGLDPGQAQIGGSAYGIAQWDGGRRTQLENYARSQGKPVSSLELQLSFLKTELDGWEGTNLVAGGFSEVTTPAQATETFLVSFERAGVPHLDRRLKLAEEFYARFGSTGGTVATVGNPCGVAGGGSPTGNFMSDSFITYSQCTNGNGYGGPWGNRTNTNGGTMCEEGCGPAALAMVVRNLTGKNITPEDMRVYYNENRLWASFGSGPVEMRQAASNFGLVSKGIHPRELAAYQETFAAGGLVVVGGQGGEPFYPGFGHYVVVRGITADGQKFLVSDPGRGKVAEYNIQEFMSYTNGREGNTSAFFAGTSA